MNGAPPHFSAMDEEGEEEKEEEKEQKKRTKEEKGEISHPPLSPTLGSATGNMGHITQYIA